MRRHRSLRRSVALRAERVVLRALMRAAVLVFERRLARTRKR